MGTGKGEQFTPELIWLFRELAERSPNPTNAEPSPAPSAASPATKRARRTRCGAERDIITRTPLTDELSLHIQLSMNDGTKMIERICVAGGVRKLNRMVSAIYDGALADTGLKTSQFSVLVSVFNRGKVRPAELTNLLQMDESTLSRNVREGLAQARAGRGSAEPSDRSDRQGSGFDSQVPAGVAARSG
jgi:hypothetical protein